MTEPLFDIIWDDAKAQRNVLKHGISFAQAATVIIDPLALTIFDAIHSETEERRFTLGHTDEGQLLAIAHTYQEMDAHTARIRLISAREATRREQHYFKNEPR
jgi:uncharacterized DUF497 family protein